MLGKSQHTTERKKTNDFTMQNTHRSTLPFKLHKSVVNNFGNISNLLFTK